MRDGVGAGAPRARRRPPHPLGARAVSGRRARATQNDPDRWLSRLLAPALRRSPETGLVQCRRRRTRTASLSCSREEVVQRAHKVVGSLDVRAMPDGKLDQAGVQQARELSRARDRNGIECAVDDTRGGKGGAGCELTELRPQIVFTQALPHGILRASGDAKWREFAGVVKVTKIPSHRKLECAT